MKTLIKAALVIDSRSKHHGKKRDILIENQQIVKIGANITEPKAKVISEKNLSVSPGWVDLKAFLADPGFEHKETIESGLKAAEKGGFRYVVSTPLTSPVIDTKGQVEYILSQSKKSKVNLLPTGCLSKKGEGKQLADMYDMSKAGAVAFTDDKHNVGTELMVRALDYSRNFGGLIISFPYDPGVNPGAMIHEGLTSVQMGMKGLSAASEEIRLRRDIELLRYVGGKMHVSLISTAGSVALIRQAKKDGLNITCAIAAHQLSFTDEDMMGFDSALKVFPPFRTKEDQKAIIKGLKDGTIDAICSDHTPEEIEHKDLEFEYASNGISGIQTAFSVALTALSKELELSNIIEKFSTGPASVLGISYPIIEEGQEASLTIFDDKTERTFGKEEWESKSFNSPFFHKNLIGRVHGII